jgi:malonyl-CoA O-methyltransferase
MPYPEVTGYTIPTLLALGEHSMARRWGAALVRMQRPDGAMPGTDGLPYVFDTAQVIRGWLALLDEDAALAEPIRRAVGWIAGRATPEGRLPAPYGAAIPEAVHLYALAPLRDAARRLALPRVEEVVCRALGVYLAEQRLTDFTTLTHFLGYILDGLLELGETARARAGAEAMRAYQQPNGEVPGHPAVAWMCPVGLAQLAVVWYRLTLDEPADHAMRALVGRQRASGGFRGSHGRGASYFPREEIGWAAKFFLDATLLQSARFFSRHADAFPSEVSATDGRVVALLQALQPAAGGRILEIGSGRGRFARAVHDALPGTSLIASDFSPRLLADVPGAMQAVEAGMLALPFPDGSMDAAFLVEALEHALIPETAVREACRVVRPGGPVVVIDKDRRALGRLKLVPWERWFERAEVAAWLEPFCDRVAAHPCPPGGDIASDGLFLVWSGRRRGDRLSPQAWSGAILPAKTAAEAAQDAVRGPAARWAGPILEVTQPGELLLELGSGTGGISAILRRSGRRVLLLDLNRDCLAFGRAVVAAMGPPSGCLQADLLAPLPLCDAGVDWAWSSGVLEHFTTAEIVAVLREARRVSRRGVLALVPNAASIPYRLGKWHQERSGTWPWGHEEPRFSLRAEFEEAGLTVVREGTVDVEHALEFFPEPEGAGFRAMMRGWLDTLGVEEQARLRQGYLLVTVGMVP